MSDDEVAQRGQTNTQNPDLSGLTNKVAELSTQLEQAKTALSERDNKIKELEGSTGGFKTANNQLTSKVTDLEAKLTAAQQTITAQTGELTNWSTKFDQLNTAHSTLTGEAASTKQQLGLYGLIAGDPKYHGLIGVVDAIKTDANPEVQKQILDKMATGFSTQTNQAIDAFRAGATTPAGNTGGSQPGGSLPTDPKAAFEEYQRLLTTNTPDAISRRAALYEVVANAQFGDGAKQQN